jgi:hypothetical protein
MWLFGCTQRKFIFIYIYIYLFIFKFIVVYGFMIVLPQSACRLLFLRGNSLLTCASVLHRCPLARINRKSKIFIHSWHYKYVHYLQKCPLCCL